MSGVRGCGSGEGPTAGVGPRLADRGLYGSGLLEQACLVLPARALRGPDVDRWSLGPDGGCVLVAAAGRGELPQRSFCHRPQRSVIRRADELYVRRWKGSSTRRRACRPASSLD